MLDRGDAVADRGDAVADRGGTDRRPALSGRIGRPLRGEPVCRNGGDV